MANIIIGSRNTSHTELVAIRYVPYPGSMVTERQWRAPKSCRENELSARDTRDSTVRGDKARTADRRGRGSRGEDKGGGQRATGWTPGLVGLSWGPCCHQLWRRSLPSPGLRVGQAANPWAWVWGLPEGADVPPLGSLAWSLGWRRPHACAILPENSSSLPCRCFLQAASPPGGDSHSRQRGLATRLLTRWLRLAQHPALLSPECTPGLNARLSAQ